MEELRQEQEILKLLKKTKQYLTSVTSFVSEQTPETPMTIRISDEVFPMNAEQMYHILQKMDEHLDALQLMSEHSISQFRELIDEDEMDEHDEVPTLSKVDFLITDSHRYVASGQFILRVAQTFLDVIKDEIKQGDM